MGGRPFSVLKRRMFIFMRLVTFGKRHNVVERCRGECIPGCHSRAECVIWVSSQVVVSVCRFTHFRTPKLGGLQLDLEAQSCKEQKTQFLQLVFMSVRHCVDAHLADMKCAEGLNAKLSSSMFVGHCLFSVNSSLSVCTSLPTFKACGLQELLVYFHQDFQFLLLLQDLKR